MHTPPTPINQGMQQVIELDDGHFKSWKSPRQSQSHRRAASVVHPASTSTMYPLPTMCPPISIFLNLECRVRQYYMLSSLPSTPPRRLVNATLFRPASLVHRVVQKPSLSDTSVEEQPVTSKRLLMEHRNDDVHAISDFRVARDVT